MKQAQIQKSLEKLGIEQLNEMQEAAIVAIENTDEVILLSPTGSGKTLAYLLPLMGYLDSSLNQVQLLILVPSRELAIQIEQVIRDLAMGFKVHAFYGGRSIKKDKLSLEHTPQILVGTPGRMADHLRRHQFETDRIQYLVLDEYDKSLEVGFEEEMREISFLLSSVQKKILTSATKTDQIPNFIELTNPTEVDFLYEGVEKLTLKSIISQNKDKLDRLYDALCYLGNTRGIVFCNFKDSIQRVSDFLTEKGVNHVCFHGDLEQQDRERALIQFRNGSAPYLIGTDLAARGIDIPEIGFIIHYHLPSREEEFIHRNGRTARMHEGGTAYVLHFVDERLPDFIPTLEEEELIQLNDPFESFWDTLYISAGRRDKISKGDVVGFLIKQGGLSSDQVGLI